MRLGCYYCMEIFDLSEVVEFTPDREPICPHCETDNVVESVYTDNDERERDRLIRIHQKKF